MHLGPMKHHATTKHKSTMHFKGPRKHQALTSKGITSYCHNYKIAHSYDDSQYLLPSAMCSCHLRVLSDIRNVCANGDGMYARRHALEELTCALISIREVGEQRRNWLLNKYLNAAFKIQTAAFIPQACLIKFTVARCNHSPLCSLRSWWWWFRPHGLWNHQQHGGCSGCRSKRESIAWVWEP